MTEPRAPFQSSSLVGHETAKAQFEAAFDSGRMPHAWLITGPEGIGKMTFAVHATHLLLSGGENRFARFNPRHRAAQLVAALAHPDLSLVQRTADEKTGILKNTISVKEARKIAPFLRLKPAFGGARVALVDEAHRLTDEAQQALLKIIEEPPDGAFVVMAATTAAALLPTIRSRCRVLPLAPLSRVELDVVLARAGVDLPSGPEKERLLQAAEGSAGTAMALLRTGALGLFDEVKILLEAAPNLDIPAVHALGQTLGAKAEEEAFAVVSRLLGNALREAARAQALGIADETGFAARFGSLDKILDLWEKTEKSLAAAQGANLDRKLVFIDAVLGIGRCARA